MNIPMFNVISGTAVSAALESRELECLKTVEKAYRAHSEGKTSNPPSHFLNFPNRANRIIALPAYLGGDFQVSGIKWISSFPENIRTGLPRASAVLILNDALTGYPYACLESSIISATRTAASAVLGATQLHLGKPKKLSSLGIVGSGLIARYIVRFFFRTGWEIENLKIYDLNPAEAARFIQRQESEKYVTRFSSHSLSEVLGQSEMIVFATTAGTPYINDSGLFSHHPTVIHISLRDLDPEIILQSFNVVDDVEHCLKAQTSPHLAELRVGNRDFVNGTIGDLLDGKLTVPKDRTRIFSPFGMGILDLAIGQLVYRSCKGDQIQKIPGFFHELTR